MAVLRRSSGLRTLAVLLLVVSLGASVPVGVLAAILPRPVFPPPPALAVESVSVSPNPPQPYQEVTVTAVLSRGGAATVRMAYVASFASTTSAGLSLSSTGPRTYQTSIGSFLPGTEVWLVVGVTMGSESVHSDYIAFQVGTVLRGGASGLQIAPPDRTPLNPGPGSTITVSASITTANGSYYPEAYVESFAIVSGYPIGDSRRMDAGYYNSTDYRATLYAYPGAFFVYRVVAQDPTGNTAVSAAFSVQIPGYNPVP